MDWDGDMHQGQTNNIYHHVRDATDKCWINWIEKRFNYSLADLTATGMYHFWIIVQFKKTKHLKTILFPKVFLHCSQHPTHYLLHFSQNSCLLNYFQTVLTKYSLHGQSFDKFHSPSAVILHHVVFCLDVLSGYWFQKSPIEFGLSQVNVWVYSKYFETFQLWKCSIKTFTFVWLLTILRMLTVIICSTAFFSIMDIDNAIVIFHVFLLILSVISLLELRSSISLSPTSPLGTFCAFVHPNSYQLLLHYMLHYCHL